MVCCFSAGAKWGCYEWQPAPFTQASTVRVLFRESDHIGVHGRDSIKVFLDTKQVTWAKMSHVWLLHQEAVFLQTELCQSIHLSRDLILTQTDTRQEGDETQWKTEGIMGGGNPCYILVAWQRGRGEASRKRRRKLMLQPLFDLPHEPGSARSKLQRSRWLTRVSLGIKQTGPGVAPLVVAFPCQSPSEGPGVTAGWGTQTSDVIKKFTRNSSDGATAFIFMTSAPPASHAMHVLPTCGH